MSEVDKSIPWAGCDSSQKLVRLLVCWAFTSWQHLMPHQDGYQLMTMCTHGATPLAYQHAATMTPFPIKSFYPDTELTNQSLPYPSNAEHQAR